MSQFEYGVVVLAIGMTVVMVALISLSLIMSLMKTVFYKDPNKELKKSKEAITEKKKEVKSIKSKDVEKREQAKKPDKKPKLVEKPKTSTKVDDKIVAIASAAVAAYTGSDDWAIHIRRKNQNAAVITAAVMAYTNQTGFNISFRKKEEKIAAISAAIAAYMGPQKPAFNIISLKRVARSEWLETGKLETLQTQIINQR